MNREQVLLFFGFLLEVPLQMLLENYVKYKDVLLEEDKRKIESIFLAIEKTGFIPDEKNRSEWLAFPPEFIAALEEVT